MPNVKTCMKLSRRTMVLATGAAALFAWNVGSAGAADITLKYSDHDPLGGMRTNFVKNVWLAEIEKQSGGKVKIQDFWGGALMSSKEAMKGVGGGVSDLGFIFPGHYPGELPGHSIFNLFPRGPNKFSDMVWLYRKAYEEVPEIKAELTKVGVMPVMVTAGLPGAFVATKPIKTLADIKGDKWRGGGKWQLRFLENAGAVPVSVPWDDVYMALQTGTIVGCFTNYDGLNLMKFDEVGKNVMISKQLWYATPFVHLMNIKKFEGLPKDVQQAILKASEIAEQKFDAVYDAAFDAVKAKELAAGYKVTELSTEDVIRWENAEKLAKLQADWVAESEKAGMKNAAQAMEKVRALHQQAMNR